MCTNINVINQTYIMIIAIYSTYSVLSQFHLPNIHSILLARNLIGTTKYRRFLMRGLRSSLCKHNSLGASYHSNTECVLY